MTKRKSNAAVATAVNDLRLQHIWRKRLHRLSAYLKKVKEKSNEYH